MFRRSKFAALLAATLAAPAMVSAASFTLDFGDVTASDFESTQVIQYSGVADGINATLTAADSFASKNDANNGSVNGDLRVNLFTKQSVDLTLTLFDATVGDGFSSVYDPGESYDWSLGIYDIDGYRDPGVYYDVVTVYSTNIANLTYTVTESTALVVTSEQGSVTFSGEVADGVPGQAGLTPPLTQDQSDVAALLTMSDTPTLTFTYTVVGQNNRERNLLVDGGEISLTGPVVTSAIQPVPVPAAGLLMLAGLASLGAVRRGRRG